ncbi:hypothetical protein [Pelagibaculum spongiae]|uniref:Uncharacterized protein n=1 Tax=Pelagibaculum spongiae TaxID=2080658 RepID=A0A2V1H5L5_9GAMM|nr:hypothetical protein [Pelagibaculum spongiae]PVZ72497.1 hypothetical protein DC094_05710 [Pelagibaculum spongiae]
MKNKKRSLRAKEAHAEQLLKISTSLLIAFLLVVLVVPLTSIASMIFNGSISFNFAQDGNAPWLAFVFLAIETTLLVLVSKTKKWALDIYDEIYPDEIYPDEINTQTPTS